MLSKIFQKKNVHPKTDTYKPEYSGISQIDSCGLSQQRDDIIYKICNESCKIKYVSQ